MNKVKAPQTFQVFLQRWEESERGWGVSDDGYSIHLSEEDYKEYIKEFAEDEKRRNPSGKVPEVYVRPGMNNLKKVFVTEETYKKLVLLKACAEFGIRFWNKNEFAEETK